MFGVNLTDLKRAKSTAAIAVAYTIAKFGADENTCSIAAAATDNLIGVFQHTTAAAGDEVEIAITGRSDVKLAGTVTLGAFVTSDASGYGVAATVGQCVIGRAMKAGVTGDKIPVQLMPGTYWITGAVEDGHSAKLVARATFDPSLTAASRTIAAHGLGVTIPDNAILTKAYIDVITTFTSAADNGTIAIHANAADDIVTAIAIADGSNVWDAGLHGTKVGTPTLGNDAAHDTALEVSVLEAASWIKLTAAREITATVAVEALTAGKAIIFVEYVISV
jgi:hypothetical protein